MKLAHAHIVKEPILDMDTKREFSKLIGFLVVALVAVGLVFNASGVKDVLLQLFNKIIGA